MIKKRYIVRLLILLLLWLGVVQITIAQSCWVGELAKDLAASNSTAAFRSFINGNSDGFYAYQKLYNAGRSGLRTNATALEAYSKAVKNAKLKQLGLTDDLLAQVKGGVNLSYEEVITNLDNFGNNITGKNITIQDFNKLVSDLLEGNAKSDGANWIVKYLGDNASGFSGKTIKFEEYTSTELGGRFVDVTDVTNVNSKVFYEFKSVSVVPPGHFPEQFMKDLTNASNLDQIKWMFNGAKNPPNFRQNMMNAIDNLPLTDNLARKFIPNNPTATSDDLKDLLQMRFDQIFKLSN